MWFCWSFEIKITKKKKHWLTASQWVISELITSLIEAINFLLEYASHLFAQSNCNLIVVLPFNRIFYFCFNDQVKIRLLLLLFFFVSSIDIYDYQIKNNAIPMLFNNFYVFIVIITVCLVDIFWHFLLFWI